MKIQNYEIDAFQNFLLEFKMIGRDSIMRSRLLKLLAERLEQIESERMQLIGQFAEQEENGSPKIVMDENNIPSYKITDIEGFNNEFQLLMNETFIIEETEDKRGMFEVLRNAVLNSTKEYSGNEALAFDRWCEVLEVV